MIKLCNLKIEGFLSINDLEIPLNQGGILWFRGRNGVGKSSILEAISWVLFGKTIKGVSEVYTWEHIRDKKYKGVKIEIFYTEEDNIYQIIRCCGYKGIVEGSPGKDRLLMYINGELIDKKGKVEIQKAIESSLEMSWDVFKNSIMFGQGVKRLIHETNSDKKKLFEEIFDLEWIEKSKKHAQGEYQKLKSEHTEMYIDLRRLQNSLETSTSTYEDLKDSEDRFETRAKENLRALKKELSQYSVDTKAKEKVEYQIRYIKSEMGLLEKSLKSLKEERNKYQSNLNRITQTDGFYDLITTIIDLIPTQPEKAIQTLSKVRADMGKINSLHHNEGELNSKIQKGAKKLRDLEKEISEINHSSKMIENIKNRIKKLKGERNTITSTKYKDKISELTKEIKILTDKIEHLDKEIEEWRWVIDEPFGNKGIKSYIIESNLSTLNEILSSYADIIGFKIVFGIDLTSVKKDFYADIEMGGVMVDYRELSGGQKQLVNVSIAFSMYEIKKGMNILFLDEVFESLSKDNVEIVTELIQKMSANRTIVLLSHHSSLSFSNVKIVHLENVDGLTIISK